MRTLTPTVVGLLMCILLLRVGGQQDLEVVPAVFLPCMESAELVPINTSVSVFSWEVHDVRPCLDNIKIDLHTMMLTLENLFFGVSTIYSFTTISTDAATSVQRNRCGLHVHSLKVDLYQELALMWEHFVQPAAREAGLTRPGNMTAEEIVDALDRPTKVAALEFHSQLNALLASLHDAHTRYTLSSAGLSPIVKFLPLHFALVDSNRGHGAPVVLARLTNGAQEAMKIVSQINGQPPLAFLQALADRRGLYLDEGQRLNALLLGDQLGDADYAFEGGLALLVGRDCDLASPGNGSVHVAFADGSEAEARWRVLLSPNDTVDLLTAQNEAFADFQVLEMDKLALRQSQLEECRQIRGCEEQLAEELVPRGADDPQAVQAYRRLFGDWPPTETLRQVSVIAASRAHGRLAQMPGRQSSSSSTGATGDTIQPFGDELADDSQTSKLRGVDKAERMDGIGIYQGWCQVGDMVQCPGSSAHCAGNQCCPGFAGSGGGTFPCPSADHSHDGCMNSTKVLNCLHIAPAPTPALAPQPAPMLAPTPGPAPAPTPLPVPPQDVDQIQECLDDAATTTKTDAVKVLYAPLTVGSRRWMQVMAVGDMIVVKMGWMGLQVSDIGAAMEGYAIAVDYARENGIKRLLLDLIGNGGGYVDLSDLFQSLFLKDYDASHLCLSYSKKVNEYWRQWILSYGDGIDKAIKTFVDSLTKKLAKLPLRVSKWLARWHLKHLRIIMTAFQYILLDLELNLGCNAFFPTFRIDRWIQTVNSFKSKGDLVRFMERIMLRQEFVPDCLYAAAGGSMRKHDRSGWFPFLGDEILERSSREPFPNLTGLLDARLQQWGDNRSAGQRYSRRGLLDTCPSDGVASNANLKSLYEQGFPDLRLHRDHPFTDVAVLTDGLAGSAASALPSKLLASGYVTLFTYGGNGKVMDSSAYAGGDVLEYSDWWRQVAVAAELGMWLLPGSPWERLNRGLNYTSDVTGGTTVIYPRPMPSGHVSEGFNFNMMTVPEFDVQGDHTSLPRQFYRLPAHKHFNVWPPNLLRPCRNPSGLLKMYARIQREDWWEVRSKPQYLDRGWSSACVPDESRRSCCEGRPRSAEEKADAGAL